VAAGEQAEQIIPQVFPGEEPGLAFRRLMANDRVAEFLWSIIEARNSRAVLLLKMAEIVNDPKARNSDKISAARLSSQMLGYVQGNGKAPKQNEAAVACEPSSQERYLRSLKLVNSGKD
jgi:hypothetical protein